MKSIRKTAAALAASFLLAAMLGLVACGGGSTSSSAASSAGSSAASASASAASTSASAATSNQLVGKPWVTSILQGNLPAEQPAAKDDVYTHYAYQYLSEYQQQPLNNMTVYSAEIPAAINTIINDKSKSNHELDQLRLFYNQAADEKALKEAGLSEIKPYIDRVNAVKSIEELNALLTADDFPFSPYILSFVSTFDVRQNFIVSVSPNLLFADPVLGGGTNYQDSDVPEMQQGLENALKMYAQMTVLDFTDLGMSLEQAQTEVTPLIAFEKQYAKDADYAGKFTKAEYGAQAQASKDGLLTLDDMCALCPNFPLKETLNKAKKGNSELYATTPGWLTSFNGCWTNENLESLKAITVAKILQETRPYRDPSNVNAMLAQVGSPVPDTATFAYTACNSLDTFGQVMAKTYVNEALGADAKTRIEAIAKEYMAEYRELISSTTWIGEQSKANLLEKLDNLTLNILEPDGGYFNYDALELTPSENGGTLFGNYLKLKQYRIDRESEMIGTPARAIYAWLAINPTVLNAFYDSSNNSINIYPGYVSSLIYKPDMSETDLLASLGFTIAHEISHGFDFAGSQYDAYGNPTPVYVAEDVDAFMKKTNALADYYSTLEPIDGVKVDGKYVVVEAAADLSGMQATMSLASKKQGFNYEQFYTKYGEVWAVVMDPTTFQSTLATDTHPLNNLRTNVNAQMIDATYDALGITEGDAMYLAPDKRIVIWGPSAS